MVVITLRVCMDGCGKNSPTTIVMLEYHISRLPISFVIIAILNINTINPIVTCTMYLIKSAFVLLQHVSHVSREFLLCSVGTGMAPAFIVCSSWGFFVLWRRTI